MFNVLKEIPHSANSYFSATTQFLSATRTIRNQAYLSENTSHPKTFSATKSALLATPLHRCGRNATEKHENCVARNSSWAEISVSCRKHSRLKFLPETPPTIIALSSGQAQKEPAGSRRYEIRIAPLAPPRPRSFLIDNMIIRIEPKSFALNANSISNRQYPGGSLFLTISSCGLSRIGNAQFPKWNRLSGGAR
jgi:hypothetical protein